MKRISTALSIVCSLAMLVAFQNCGSAKSAGSAASAQQFASSEERVTPVEKSISEISIPVQAFNVRVRADLKTDGRVISEQDGSEYAIDPALKSEIASILSSAELCNYEQVLPEGSVSCMAMPIPHAFALTAEGEEIALATDTMCSSSTVDLCQDQRAHFQDLITRIQKAIAK